MTDRTDFNNYSQFSIEQKRSDQEPIKHKCTVNIFSHLRHRRT